MITKNQPVRTCQRDVTTSLDHELDVDACEILCGVRRQKASNIRHLVIPTTGIYCKSPQTSRLKDVFDRLKAPRRSAPLVLDHEFSYLGLLLEQGRWAWQRVVTWGFQRFFSLAGDRADDAQRVYDKGRQKGGEHVGSGTTLDWSDVEPLEGKFLLVQCLGGNSLQREVFSGQVTPYYRECV